MGRSRTSGLPLVTTGASRVEPYGTGQFPASPQQEIRLVARPPGPVHEEEFLLEADPANRDVHASLRRYCRARTLRWREAACPNWSADVWCARAYSA